MKTNRNPSTENSIQKKQKVNTEDIISLTLEDAKAIESGSQELDIADNLQAIKKTVPKTHKQNKPPKETKGQTNNKNVYNKMKTNRNPSTEKSIQKKRKINTEDIISLTLEDAKAIESGSQELDIADNPQAIKKTVPKTHKQNKPPKETKGQTNNKNDDRPTENRNSKKFKKEKQELQLKCKSQKCPFYEAVVKVKRIWELVRRDGCPKKRKETLLKDLFKYSKPHLETMVYTHDTICIVQWMLNVGTPEIRSQVINELIKHVPKMILCQYASLCVKNMLKQGDAEQRNIIINSLKGKVFTYTLHTNSAKIMDLIYTTYATPQQQNVMMHELYGASSILCDSPNVSSFTDVLNNSPNTKDIILAKTKDNIRKFILKQKTSMQTTLVHKLIYEYILYFNISDEEYNELLTSLIEFPIELFYTSESGCYLAKFIIWFANSKEKKSILKQIKTTAATCDLATSEYGYLILFTLIDTVEDAVLIKKTIISDILKNLETIATNENGRNFILGLLAWKDSSYFHPQDIDPMKKEESLNECKDDDKVRAKELLDVISDGFLQHIQNYPKFWLSCRIIGIVLLEILISFRGAKLKEAMTSIANFLIDPKSKVKDRIGKVPVFEDFDVYLILKMIIGEDKILAKNNEATFSEVLSSVITTDTLKSWVQCNLACYLLVAMIESKVELAVENIKSLFSTTMMDLLKEQQFDGAKVLLAKLNFIATKE